LLPFRNPNISCTLPRGVDDSPSANSTRAISGPVDSCIGRHSSRLAGRVLPCPRWTAEGMNRTPATSQRSSAAVGCEAAGACAGRPKMFRWYGHPENCPWSGTSRSRRIPREVCARGPTGEYCHGCDPSSGARVEPKRRSRGDRIAAKKDVGPAAGKGV
jgi:hypothetical protein